ncbi:MFS general substrate transporter [Piedraia hortae CBS 480.64]|uniref:MFS general substrate transporter n=1 Tax=Piedraia hortae CBS 480.64 TaxID=1314780 RepID=A0A6A7BUK8_9PEZI|nr:MFS general substrate transporter [Piedraia hortae CBS 480.64]
MASEEHEGSPLLPKPPQPGNGLVSAVNRALFTAFLVSLSFGVTQVPLIYVFGLMTCEEYYKHHADPGTGETRCRVHEIEASTARSVALLGISTTFFGAINLFFTNWTMKVLGIKKALLLTIFFPSARLMLQNVGVEVGSGPGIIIVQASQIITAVGGPVGYLLALNSFAAEVVQPAERTATLGRVSGCAMFGTSLGYLIGGLLGQYLGIIWPFRVTIVLFLVSCVYAQLCLPAIGNNEAETEAEASKSIITFLDPIKALKPQKWHLSTGKVQREYGVILLSLGAFLGVLATSYIPVLLQMYSTDVFGFGTWENGLLISINSFVRGIFLTVAFPTIIAKGRQWLKHDKEDEEGLADQSSEMEEKFIFDLAFTKYSLILDGILTGLCTFTLRGWQMYMIAVVLPLASGTGPAARGTILQMCPARQRTDALSAISLVELMARLSSTGLFGLVFACFAEVGRQNLTFAVNGAIAVVGFVVLIFARFPPHGSGMVNE